jgi:hypothetical protein
MVDELALKIVSCMNIVKLCQQADKPELFQVMLYLILVYPFASLFINIDCIKF